MTLLKNSTLRHPQYVSSRQSGPSGNAGKPLKVKSNTKKCYYILQAWYATYTAEREVCSRKKEVFNFKKLTTPEANRFWEELLPRNRIVNWTE